MAYPSKTLYIMSYETSAHVLLVLLSLLQHRASYYPATSIITIYRT